MTETDKAFVGSIPAIYDRYLGPLFFEPYAADLSARLAGIESGRVLEVAAGTGIVTLAMARTLARGVEIVATDLNQPMLDFAAKKDFGRTISWRQADALALPFDDASFDIVVCQFGVMFFPDRPAAYREAMRVLKPRGRFVFNVWDHIETNEIAYAVTEAVARLFPVDPPRFMARIPHGYFDTNRIRDDLLQAGVADVKIETVTRRGRAPSPHDPAIGICQGSPLRNEIEARDANRLEEATEAAARAIAARFGYGAIDAKMQAHIVVAIK